MCEEEAPTKVFYQSNITRYGDYSADQLVGYIEEWVQQGALLIDGVVVVTLDSNCAVRISGIDEPVCDPVTSSQSSDAVVATTLVLSTIATLMIVTIVLLNFCTKQRKKR